MKDLLKNKYFILTLRFLIGGIFIYAAIGKIVNPEAFAKAIYNYRFLPIVFVNISAIIIPWIEFVSGVMIIMGIFKKGSALLIMILLGIFTILLIQAYFRGLDISCGCFSLETSGNKSDILLAIFRDIILFMTTFLLYKSFETKKLLINKGDIQNGKFHPN